MFPQIHNIKDVEKYIEGCDSFIKIDRGDHTVIDYVFMDQDTFRYDNNDLNSYKHRLECRGIVFCNKTGKIIRRPLEKFFNIGEKEQTLSENIDWSRDHLVMTKLDGSMLSPMYLPQGFRLGTRKGITNVSCWAENFMVHSSINYRGFMDLMESCDYSPVFEFFSKENMIVLDYGESFMKLLACRKKVTGEYMSYQEMFDIASDYGVPVVDQIKVNLNNPKSFLDSSRLEKDCEGYIIRFEGQESVKVKNDWYVQIHHLVSGLNKERNIIKLLLENGIDDILPLLPEQRKHQIQDFCDGFTSFYKTLIKEIENKWSDIKLLSEPNWSRKDWAFEILKHDKKISWIFFEMLKEGSSIKDLVKTMILKSTEKDKDIEEFMIWADLEVLK